MKMNEYQNGLANESYQNIHDNNTILNFLSWRLVLFQNEYIVGFSKKQAISLSWLNWKGLPFKLKFRILLLNDGKVFQTFQGFDTKCSKLFQYLPPSLWNYIKSQIFSLAEMSQYLQIYG